MVAEITLRPISAEDMEFLYQVYAGTRQEELSVLDWSDEEKAQFLRMQFDAQHKHYQTHFTAAAYDVILAGDTPIGRLYVDRRPDELRIIDIALLAEHRGGGIGGGLLRELLSEAAAAGKPVTIHVEKNNRAKSLYHRLGFREIEDQGVYDLMEWRPATEAAQEEN